jgi:hypothetical protein
MFHCSINLAYGKLNLPGTQQGGEVGPGFGIMSFISYINLHYPPGPSLWRNMKSEREGAL